MENLENAKDVLRLTMCKLAGCQALLKLDHESEDRQYRETKIDSWRVYDLEMQMLLQNIFDDIELVAVHLSTWNRELQQQK